MSGLRARVNGDTRWGLTHDLEGEIQIKSGNPGVRTHDVEVSWHAKNDKRRREFLDSFHWSFPMFNFILDDFCGGLLVLGQALTLGDMRCMPKPCEDTLPIMHVDTQHTRPIMHADTQHITNHAYKDTTCSHGACATCMGMRGTKWSINILFSRQVELYLKAIYKGEFQATQAIVAIVGGRRKFKMARGFFFILELELRITTDETLT
uniref:Uncharacterized protein n=1 Tax=Cucumis melo TaxID=3656 RepID=A0A9I9EGB8_CUCME